MKTLFFILISMLTFSSVAGQNITREYDEFTGELCFKTELNASLDAKKLITENGDKLIILVWHRKEITTSRPDGGNSILTFLFSDNTRMTVDFRLVVEYDEFMSNVTLNAWASSNITSSPVVTYAVKGEVILNASQIAKLKEKRVKKYRMGDSGKGIDVDDPEQFRNSFLALLQAN